jgi:hypothetical protein
MQRLLGSITLSLLLLLSSCQPFQQTPHENRAASQTPPQVAAAAPLPQDAVRLVGTWEYTTETVSITLQFSPEGRFSERQRYAGHLVQSRGVYLVYAIDASQLRILRFIEEFTPSDVIYTPIRDELTVTWQDVETLRTPYGVFHRSKKQ